MRIRQTLGDEKFEEAERCGAAWNLSFTIMPCNAL